LLTISGLLSIEGQASLNGSLTNSDGNTAAFATSTTLTGAGSIQISSQKSLNTSSYITSNNSSIINGDTSFSNQGTLEGKASKENSVSSSLTASSYLSSIPSVAISGNGEFDSRATITGNNELVIGGSFSIFGRGTLTSDLTDAVGFLDSSAVLATSSTIEAPGTIISRSETSLNGSASLTGDITSPTFSATLACSATISANGVLSNKVEPIRFTLYINTLEEISANYVSQSVAIDGESLSVALFDCNINQLEPITTSLLPTSLSILLAKESLYEADMNINRTSPFSVSVETRNVVTSYLESDSPFELYVEQYEGFTADINTNLEVTQ